MTRSTLARLHIGTISLESATAARAFAVLGAVQVTLIAAITIVTVALPAIGASLRLDEPGLVLVSSGYGISFGGLLLLGGRLADRYGLRRAFVSGTVIFGAGSAGAGLAPSAAALVAARLTQGAGAALAAPAAVALLGTVYREPGQRRPALARWGVLSSAGAITGTVLSGVLITWISWRWVFAAPAVVAAALAPRVLPGTPALSRQPIGWPGGLLATAGLAALIYGLQHSGWAVGVLLLSFLSVPYAGLVLIPLGAGLTFSAATVASMLDAGQAQPGMAGALVATATETGPPLGLAVLTWVAAAWPGQLSAGYPFALRMAAVALLVLFTLCVISQRRNSAHPNSAHRNSAETQ